MWYDTLILRILNMTLTGSLVIIIVLLGRLLLKKAPRILSYGLWAVVLFRLLCPVTLSSGVSLLNLLDVPATERSTIEYIPENIVSAPFPTVDFLVDPASDVVNDSLPQGWEQVNERPLASLIHIATAVWLAGMGAMLVYSLVSLLRLRKHLSGAELLRDDIFVCRELETPIVMGLLRPKVYLPASLTPEEQDHVLLHEFHHIWRGDHIIRPLSFIALTVHWFNPLVWVAFFLSEKDMEMSCDEAVVQKMSKEDRCDYSQSLLQLAAGHRASPVSPLSFCEGDPAGRIRNILRWRAPSRRTWAVCICICLLLCVSLATDPVVAVETVTYQPFIGRIALTLPEGYDYALLSDPYFWDNEPNVIIYRSNSAYPVCDGCLSLDFSKGGTYALSGENHSRTVALNTGFALQYTYAGKGLDWNWVQCISEDFGTISILPHNVEFWTEQDYADYDALLQSITITGYEKPIYFDLSGHDHLAVSIADVSDYFLYTESGTLPMDLSGVSGEVTVELYEAFTDKLVGSFHSSDAARDDHHVFTGISRLKAYYFVVSGADTGEITIFQKEG